MVAADAIEEEEEQGESTHVVRHVPTSCFVGEWGEWSACDATCLGAYNFPQRYRKRTPIVAEVANTDPDCILEEKQACGHSLESCVGYCWVSEWTEWSDCMAVMSKGEISFSQRRYKPILAGAEYCDMEAIQELQACTRSEKNIYIFACLLVCILTQSAEHLGELLQPPIPPPPLYPPPP